MSDDLVAFLRARLDEEAELHPAIARHVAFHDPARVLRVIEARRRILARHRLSPAGGDPELPWEDRNDCQFDGEDWPCDDLRELVVPYADHRDCRAEWLPHEMRTDQGSPQGTQSAL